MNLRVSYQKKELLRMKVGRISPGRHVGSHPGRIAVGRLMMFPDGHRGPGGGHRLLGDADQPTPEGRLHARWRGSKFWKC